jgi:hypothetical protein
MHAMDLFLHIGPHKTGTTAIQTCFAENRSALRRQGILYPKCNWAYPAQHRLAFAMKDKVNPVDGTRPDFETELAALCSTLAKARQPRAVVSSEEFFAAPKERIAAFHAALPVQNVTILAYPRSPDRFLVSCYNQKIKQVGNGFAAPIARFLKEPHKIAPEIDYLACISAWADVFGDENIRLTPFEAGSPLRHIARLLGINALVTDKPVNQSVPGAVAEAMRLAKLQDLTPDRQRKLFAKASEVFAKHPPFSISQKSKCAILETFQTDNDALFARFGQENPWSETRPQHSHEDEPQNITVHDLMRLIATLL